MEEEEEEGEAGCAARGAAVGSGANGGRITYASIAVESFCCVVDDSSEQSGLNSPLSLSLC